MTAPLSHSRAARRPAALIGLALTLAAILGAWRIFDIAPWIVVFLLLFTLPALAELWAGSTAGSTLDDTALEWFAGKGKGRVDLADIDHVRLDTRWDFTVRATAVLRTGAVIRLPQDAMPPHKAFESALNARGVRTRRHHFEVF